MLRTCVSSDHRSPSESSSKRSATANLRDLRGERYTWDSRKTSLSLSLSFVCACNRRDRERSQNHRRGSARVRRIAASSKARPRSPGERAYSPTRQSPWISGQNGCFLPADPAKSPVRARNSCQCREPGGRKSRRVKDVICGRYLEGVYFTLPPSSDFDSAFSFTRFFISRFNDRSRTIGSSAIDPLENDRSRVLWRASWIKSSLYSSPISYKRPVL